MKQIPTRKLTATDVPRPDDPDPYAR